MFIWSILLLLMIIIGHQTHFFSRFGLSILRKVYVGKLILYHWSLRKKYPYLEFFWSIFSCIRTKYGKVRSNLSVFTLNAGKYELEKLRIRSLFTQCVSFYTPWKYQKNRGFLMLLRCIGRDWWHEMSTKLFWCLYY